MATAAATPHSRYSRVAIALHWTIAALIVGNLIGGAVLGNDLIAAAPLRTTVMTLHQSFGLTILLLSAARLVWRLTNPPPPLPDHMTAAEHLLAKTTHWLFYGLMFVLPLTGWAMSSTNTKYPIPYFWLFDVPKLAVEQGKASGGFYHGIHEIAAYVAIATLALHIRPPARSSTIIRPPRNRRRGARPDDPGWGWPRSAQQALRRHRRDSSWVRRVHYAPEVVVKTRTELTTERKALRRRALRRPRKRLRGSSFRPAGRGRDHRGHQQGHVGEVGSFRPAAALSARRRAADPRTGKADNKGHAGGGAAVAVSAIVFLPAGFFMTGTSARLPAGTVIKGFLAEDVPVAFVGDSAPAPLMVGLPQGPTFAPVAQPTPAVVLAVAAPGVKPGVLAAKGGLVPQNDGSTKLVTK